jgi:hypothetical protein
MLPTTPNGAVNNQARHERYCAALRGSWRPSNGSAAVGTTPIVDAILAPRATSAPEPSSRAKGAQPTYYKAEERCPLNPQLRELGVVGASRIPALRCDKRARSNRADHFWVGALDGGRSGLAPAPVAPLQDHTPFHLISAMLNLVQHHPPRTSVAALRKYLYIHS